MTAVRIVGIGSPHGADAAGWLAIEALRHVSLEAQFPAGWLSLQRCRSPAQLPQLLAGSRCAIVIDAVSGPGAGVLKLDTSALQNRTDLASVHGIGVGEMLALIATLEVQPPEMTVLGIGIDPKASPATVEQRVASLVPRLMHCIQQTVAAFLELPEPTEEKCVGVMDN